MGFSFKFAFASAFKLSPEPPHRYQIQTMMAASKVFDIPEMLEMMLLELPFFDLVRAIGVNKTFRNCISSSNKLQCKLFYKQTPIGPNNYTVEPSVNPAFKRIIQRNHAAWNTAPLVQPPAIMYIDESPSNLPCARVRSDMELMAKPPRFEASAPHQSQFYLRPEIDLKFEKSTSLLPCKRKVSSSESWQEMYLTDRACGIRVIVNTMPRYTQHLFNLPPDVNMADLIDAVDSKIERERTLWNGLWNGLS